MQWITLRHVIDLLIRLDAPEQAAVLYGALPTSGTATPARGADADRLATYAAILQPCDLGVDRCSAAIARDTGRVVTARAKDEH